MPRVYANLAAIVGVAIVAFATAAAAQIIKDKAAAPIIKVDAAAPITKAEAAAPIIGGDAPASAAAVRYGQPIATRYRVGAKIVARGSAVENIRLMVAVPLECAEQEVRVVEEDFSPHVENVAFRLLPPDDGARQMLITISTLPARQEAHALITYDVITKPVIAPDETASLRIPLKLDRKLKQYVSGSPFIDVNHRKIRSANKEALAKLDESSDDAKPQAAGDAAVEPTAWQHVEALYDYAIEKVEYEEGVDKSAVQVLDEGKGDCQAIAALFVAMCRTEKVPARLVWVDGHQYAEFYLEEETGAGHWYPVQSAGSRAFGEMPSPKVILQKGDNFRVPERRRERLRYASDYALLLADPAAQPKVTYVRETL